MGINFMDEEFRVDPLQIVQSLLQKDPFSQWIGVKILDVKFGYCKLQCIITKQMLNGFNIAHGGIIFSLADTALAFSAATTGRVALALNNSITFTRKAKLNDVLTATSKKVNLTNRTGLFEVTITNQDSEIIALLKGTVYRTRETL